MKKNIFISILAAFSILTACSERPDIVFPDGGMTITALTELPDSKTTVVSETQVYWEPGDEITVFSGDMQGRFVTDITEPAAMATFKGMLYGEPDETLWAVYPYSKDATFDGETITTVLPSVQTARAGTFGKNMNLTVAKSSNSTLQFYNVGGGVRFSVTEDDIKKVIFEGLNGEILAGTVKIGFENDRPKVQEVAGGSPFITLLPPDGETFQKGKWYFIVAIPGALENGYKLRFYKDEDYARRISENAVTITRSIYGTVASADAESEYESITTNFPETEEEWEESVKLTYSIGEQVSELIESNNISGESDFEKLLLDSKEIEGVIDVVLDETKSTLSVMQSDSIWVNYLIESEQALPSSKATVSTKSSPNFTTTDRLVSTVASHNQSALILAPFNFGLDVDEIKKDLIHAGFSEDNIDYFSGPEADILKFRGQFLSKYSLIVIDTHGGTGYTARSKGDDGYKVNNQTVLTSSTVYSPEVVSDFISSGDLNWAQIAIVHISGEQFYRLAMTPRFLYNSTFTNSCVFLKACVSASILTEGRGNGSMVWQFIDSGAGVVSGYDETMNSGVLGPFVEKMIKMLSHGLSFKDAYSYLEHSGKVKKQNTDCYNALHEYKPLKYHSFTEFDILNHHYYRQKNEAKPYHILDPYPKINNAIVNGDYVEMTWTCNLEDFDVKWEYLIKKDADYNYYTSENVDYSISYDTYINDSYVATRLSKKLEINNVKPGNYDWYVVARMMEGDTEVASYKSAVGKFTVEQAGDAIMEFNKDVELGMVKMGQSTTKSVTIKNTGDAPLVISEISGYDPSILSFEWTNATIAPGDSKPLAITLKQPTPGDGYHFAYIMSNAKNYENTYSYFFITWCGQRTTPAYSTQMVDLGLSVKWATCDLGSDSPYEYGELYAWGETDRKSSYTWDNYKWGRSTSLTKYNESDNLRSLQKSDDAAAAHLGGQWHMPSQNECQELIDNCNWRATTVNNIDVFEGTSKINGKKIYFKRKENTVGQLYVLWTKDLWYDEIANIFTLNYYDFDSDECVLEASVGQYRSNGYYIRPVYGVESTPVHAFSVSPSSFNFGEVNVGQSSERKVFAFNNGGDADVEFWVESCPDGFIYPDGMHGGTHSRVPAHGSRSGFWIRFDPTQAKNYSGTVVLRTNDSEFPVVRINVSGKGVRSGSGGGEPRMSLSSDSYDFGTVAVNTNKKTSFTITNTGTADLDVTTIKLVNGNKGFYLANTTKTGIVPPGGTCTINVMFRPTKKGSVSEQILVKSNATNKSYTMIYLSGTGQ